MICYCFSPVKGHSSWPRFGLLGVFSSSSLSRARSAPLFLSARAHQPRRPDEADVVPSASSDARWLVDLHMQFNTAVRVINNHVGVVLYPWPRVITSGALICYRCYQSTSGPWCNACKKCRYMKQTTKYIKLQKKHSLLKDPAAKTQTIRLVDHLYQLVERKLTNSELLLMQYRSQYLQEHNTVVKQLDEISNISCPV